MAPKSYTLDKFDALRRDQAWTRISTFPSVAAAGAYLTSPTTQWTVGATTQKALTSVLAQADAHGKPIKAGQVLVGVDRKDDEGYLSLTNTGNSTVQVWTFAVEAKDALGCFQRMAVLAKGSRTGCSLRMMPQEDRAFMWKAPLMHPMQARENVYQRVVHAAGRDPGASDPLAAASEALARYFQQDEGATTPMVGIPPKPSEREHWASVRMNHLIDTFYLFRLLVRYQVVAEGDVDEDLRVDLSGALTKLLHNGDPKKMGWLFDWLAKKVADLGKRMAALNGPGERKVIFFLKGGRALNYYLGTPEKGENDWDTQVVIDPSLPATEWYALLAKVHDTLLVALEKYSREFTDLVEKNLGAFEGYLSSIDAPPPTDDEEIDENELSDVGSRFGRAGCKAELIDIGLPRRDTPAALEEWLNLSPEGAILAKDGVNYPHRPYYVNEYLMMIREAFLPGADVHKSPKRVARLSLLLKAPAGDAGHDQGRLLKALPQTKAAIEAVPSGPRREILTTVGGQFAQAYSLAQDKGFAEIVDHWGAELVASPPPLSGEFQKALERLTDEDRSLAQTIGVAHALSERLSAQAALRSTFILKQRADFDDLLLRLRTRLEPLLVGLPAQFAVVGSYAARLHAEQLRLGTEGLEPVRRIVVHLQHPQSVKEKDVLDTVRATVLKVIDEAKQLEPVPLEATDDPKGRTLSFRWNTPVGFGAGVSYQPLVFKIRAAAQVGEVLPVLSSIRGLPVLDMRFLADDYLRKSAKTHELGMGKVLREASQAIVEMMSHFDVSAIRQVDPDDAV